MTARWGHSQSEALAGATGVLVALIVGFVEADEFGIGGWLRCRPCRKFDLLTALIGALRDFLESQASVDWGRCDFA